jgi:cytochrome c biogenesis protein CcdA
MTQTWQPQNAAARTRAGAINSIPDVTDFPEPSSGVRRALLMALSAAAGAAIGGTLAPIAPIHTFLVWLLVPLAFAGGLLSTWSPCGYSSVCLLRPNGAASLRSVIAWLPTLFAHAIGYAIGGVVLGGALGLAGYALGLDAYLAYALPAFAGLLALYGAHQFGFVRVPYPQRRCQVPHDARQRFPKWVIGLLYGFSLGLNYLTYVQTPLLYAVTGVALFSGSVAFAVSIFLVFNLGRFLPLLVNALPVSDVKVTAWLARNQENAATVDAALLVGSGFAVAMLLLA